MTSSNVTGIIITAVVSYLLGSINFAMIISKIKKDDIRQHGSGNAGMTNILRTYGKSMAVLTAAGDFLKGLVAILIARYIFFPLFGVTLPIDGGYIAGLFALLGHIFPLYFGFRGGKGVMTTLGIMIALDPLVFIALLAVTLPIIFISRIVSLGSVVGAILLPIFTLVARLIQNRPFGGDLLCTILIGGIVLFKHRSNVQRLLNGTENRFQRKNNKV